MEILELIQRRMAQDYPHVKVVGVYSPPFRAVYSSAEITAMIKAVNTAAPDVLWVGLSAPKQEKFIFENRERLNVKFVAAVGAVFDFLQVPLIERLFGCKRSDWNGYIDSLVLLVIYGRDKFQYQFFSIIFLDDSFFLNVNSLFDVYLICRCLKRKAIPERNLLRLEVTDPAMKWRFALCLNACSVNRWVKRKASVTGSGSFWKIQSSQYL